MAASRTVDERDGSSSGAAESPDEVDSISQTRKRRSSSPPGPDAPPPHKSPRTETVETVEGLEGPGGEDTQKPRDNMEEPPHTHRKSWRRATISRRSLPALPTPHQGGLCRNISMELPQEKRLEQLMEDAMKLAVGQLQASLQSVSSFSPETFQNQLEKLETEWRCVARSFQGEAWSPQRCVNPALQRASENVKMAISRLQAESNAWESLLDKHRSRVEQLERQLAEGERKVTCSDPSLLALSSQFHLIQTKPDYRDVLGRQQPRLHTMAMMMDSQAKTLRELLSIKEQAQLMVKETSGRLAAEAGLQDLSPDLAKDLMRAPYWSTAA